MKEYFHAKREAARRLGTRHLPTNREIHDELLRIARQVDGEGHARRLEEMRQAALGLMETLVDYQPRLIGSVLTGHIRRGSDIDLHAYTDDLESLCGTLEQAGREFVVESVRSRKHQQIMEFVHLRLSDVGGHEAEITVYPYEWLFTHPRCGITGGPMKRATLAEVRLLMATGPSPDLLTSPVDFVRLEAACPEVRTCRGVQQNHYHHLDVYDHTLEVVRGNVNTP